MMDIVGAYIIVDGSTRNPQSSLIIQVTLLVQQVTVLGVIALDYTSNTYYINLQRREF